MITWDYILFQIGTLVFAVSGVTAAIKKNMDILSFMLIGVVTAVGGGTVRDILLGTKIFWLNDFNYIYVAIIAAILTFSAEHFFRSSYKFLLYCDAIAVALFTIPAIEKTLSLGMGKPVAVLMGIVTGIGGGIIRDLITGRPTIVLSREIYITPILIGSILFVLLRDYFVSNEYIPALISIIIITSIRFAAIHWKLAFPDTLTYKSKD